MEKWKNIKNQIQFELIDFKYFIKCSLPVAHIINEKQNRKQMSSFLIFISFYFLNQMFATSQQAISVASIKVQLSHIENLLLLAKNILPKENWQWNLNIKMYYWMKILWNLSWCWLDRLFRAYRTHLFGNMRKVFKIFINDICVLIPLNIYLWGRVWFTVLWFLMKEFIFVN